MKKKGNTSFESPDRLNVIVEGSKVVGDMITESNLRIDGEVLGNVTSASKVVVGENGSITGNLICTDADIEGRVNGILKVDGLLTLRAKSVVDGEITTSKFEVIEGAQFSGNCRMNNFSGGSNVKSTESQEDLVY